MIYSRLLLSALRKQIQTPEVVVLTGMRQVGKTTLYRMIFDEVKSDNKVFLDIENPIEQKIFEEADFNNILANLETYGINPRKKLYVFLDEIQAKPDIVKAIKYLHDHYAIKFFVTGSSSFYFKNVFPESLAGRKAIFELYPLTFREFLAFRGIAIPWHEAFPDKERSKNVIGYERIKKFYEEYLVWGGFPAVVLAENQEQKAIRLNDIFKSYFEKDVKALADVRNLTALRDLLLLLLQRIGSKLEVSKLASEVGVSRETVYTYLAFLEGTYFIHLVSPYSRNRDREVSGAKKLYACDVGVANKFAKISSGQLLENAVFQNLRPFDDSIHYYQRRSGVEVDFVMPQRSLVLEVKHAVAPRDYAKAESIARALKFKHVFVVSKAFSPEKGFIPANMV